MGTADGCRVGDGFLSRREDLGMGVLLIKEFLSHGMFVRGFFGKG